MIPFIGNVPPTPDPQPTGGRTPWLPQKGPLRINRSDPSSSAPICLAWVEHRPWLKSSWAAAISGTDGMTSLGSYPNLQTLLYMYDGQPPDIILTDIPRIGLKADLSTLQILQRCFTRTRMVVVLPARDARFIRPAMIAGASAYTLMDAGPERLTALVREVCGVEGVGGPEVVSKCLQQMRDDGLLARKPRDPLTPRQREVLRTLAAAPSCQAAAAELGLTIRGLRSHTTRIYGRLGASSLREAILAYAGVAMED